MAIDFPASPSLGQTFTAGGLIWTWDGTAWNLPSSSQINTARRGNHVVNPSAQHSQENGNAAVGNAAYPADQWLFSFGGFTAGAVRSQSLISPDGSPNSILQSFSVTRPSPAATDYCQLYQTIEGERVSDLEWGTAKAKPAILRFNAACETAGTYTVSIRSSDQAYSWLASFTCDGTLNLKTYAFPVPAPPSGTWAKDNTGGALIAFCYACGTTYGGGVAGWQTGNKLAIAGQTNGATVANKNLVVTDVGLYVDPDNTGLPPPFETPDPTLELLKCQRYFRIIQPVREPIAGSNYAGASVILTPVMRTTPTISYKDLASNPSKVSTGSGNNVSFTAGGFAAMADVLYVDALLPASQVNWWAAIVTLNARM